MIRSSGYLLSKAQGQFDPRHAFLIHNEGWEWSWRAKYKTRSIWKRNDVNASYGDLRDLGLGENDGGTRQPRDLSQQIRVSGFHRCVRPLWSREVRPRTGMPSQHGVKSASSMVILDLPTSYGDKKKGKKKGIFKRS